MSLLIRSQESSLRAKYVEKLVNCVLATDVAKSIAVIVKLPTTSTARLTGTAA